jgi:hypothetical protein
LDFGGLMAEEATAVFGDKRIEEQVKDQKHCHKEDGFYGAPLGSVLEHAGRTSFAGVFGSAKLRAFGRRKDDIKALPACPASVSLLIPPLAK